jgi:diguanylate cyclase (GGDEF)-like protein
MAGIGIAVFAGMGAVQFALLGWSAMTSFGRVEDRTSLEHIHRARNAIKGERLSLLEAARSRAARSELVAAMGRADQSGIKDSFSDTWADRSGTDLVLLRDAAGHGAWAALRADPASRLQQLEPDTLLRLALPGGTRTFEEVDILRSPKGPLILVTEPLVDSEGRLSGRGTLTLGRYLAWKPTGRIAESLQVRVDLLELRDSGARSVSEGEAGWYDLKDVGRDRRLVLPVSRDDDPEPVYLLLTYSPESGIQALSLLAQMALLYLVMVAFAVLLAFTLIRRHVIRPILSVAAHLDRAAEGGSDLPLALGAAAGRLDEIGLLADRVDQLIAAESQRKEELAAVNKELERRASTDPLTGLANRRSFADSLEREKRRILRERQGTPPDEIAFVVCDIDCFKRYNDRYGHRSGDVCLRAVADAIQGALARPTDLACRQGGEEFLVMLPGTDEEGGVMVAERIREAVESLGLEHADSTAAPFVTLSLGVAARSLTEDFDQQELFELADAALYRAKATGKNRVVAASKAS